MTTNPWIWTGSDTHAQGPADLSRPDSKESVGQVDAKTGRGFAVIIPKLVVISRIEGNAKNLAMSPSLPGSEYLGCAVTTDQIGLDCNVGWCKWRDRPVVNDSTADERVISWYFINWSHDYHREAKLAVSFYYIKGT